jgi:flagellar hook assembly protein FlgD
MQNFPNPFNPRTTIEFALPKPENVTLCIYDIGGRLISRVLDAVHYSEGWHSISWDGKNAAGRRVATGVYFYRFNAGEFSETKRMVLVR